jgi:hypothetical protein
MLFVNYIYYPLCIEFTLLYYEAEFISKLLHEKKHLMLWPSIRYFDIHVSTMFYLLTTISSTHTCMSIQSIPNELEIKDTTECSTSVSHLGVLLKFDTNGKFMTQHYDKRDGVKLIRYQF